MGAYSQSMTVIPVVLTSAWTDVPWSGIGGRYLQHIWNIPVHMEGEWAV
jgi:hypothetical protein